MEKIVRTNNGKKLLDLDTIHTLNICGGVPGGCATCAYEMEQLQIAVKNREFDNQLWTFIAVREDGSESVLYGHATNNVFVHALAQADEENSSLKVVKYIGNFKCDYSQCEGHGTEHGYCSATRMYEDMTENGGV